MNLKITPLLTGILFDDPAGWFMSFDEVSALYTVETPASERSTADDLARSGLQLVMPLLLGAKPELLSQPASAMATWVSVLRVDGGTFQGVWAASFERGSLEGIKLRVIDQAFKAQMEAAGVIAEGAPLAATGVHAMLKMLASEPLVWFPL